MQDLQFHREQEGPFLEAFVLAEFVGLDAAVGRRITGINFGDEARPASAAPRRRRAIHAGLAAVTVQI